MHNRGNIIDIISGRTVPLTPEEVNVQYLAKWILSLGYHKEQLQTHPQYKITHNKRSFWIDIGVFEDGDRTKPPLIICECKKNGKGNDEGIEQLRGYLKKIGTKVGIWFDGNDISYIINISNAINYMNIGPKSNLPEIECGAFIRSKREEMLENDPTFSLRGFSKKIGIQPTYLSKIERGMVPASDEIINKIADALSIDKEQIYARSGRVSPEVKEVMLARPDLFNKLMDMMKNMSDSQIKEVTRRVRDGDW